MDNLRDINDNIEIAINPLGPPGSIKAVNHQKVLKEVLFGAGKLIGFYYKMDNRTDSIVGTGNILIHNVNFASVAEQVLRVSTNTIDNVGIGSLLDSLNPGSLFYIKDINGVAYKLEFVSFVHSTDPNATPVVDITIKGFTTNASPTLEVDGTLACGLTIFNLPQLGTAAFNASTDFATKAQGDLADSAIQSGDLAPVAFTGQYGDLGGVPTIPQPTVLYMEHSVVPITGEPTSDAYIAANPNKLLFFKDSRLGGKYYWFDAEANEWKTFDPSSGGGGGLITGSQGISAFGSDVQLGGTITKTIEIDIIDEDGIDGSGLYLIATDAIKQVESNIILDPTVAAISFSKSDGAPGALAYVQVAQDTNVPIVKIFGGGGAAETSGSIYVGNNEGVRIFSGVLDSNNEVQVLYDQIRLKTTKVNDTTAIVGQVLTLKNINGEVEWENSIAPTGLEALDEGNGIGWRLIGQDSTRYLTIGEGAVDFSFNPEYPPAKTGASGNYSLSAGLGSAYGPYSIAGGYYAAANGQGSIAFGLNAKAGLPNGTISGAIALGDVISAYGAASVGLGKGITVDSYAEIGVGSFCTSISLPNSRTAFNVDDRIFVIGIGTSTSARKDAISVLKSGMITAPSLTNTMIDAGSDFTLVTKGWVQTNTPVQEVIDFSPTVLGIINPLDISASEFTSVKTGRVVNLFGYLHINNTTATFTDPDATFTIYDVPYKPLNGLYGTTKFFAELQGSTHPIAILAEFWRDDDDTTKTNIRFYKAGPEFSDPSTASEFLTNDDVLGSLTGGSIITLNVSYIVSL